MALDWILLKVINFALVPRLGPKMSSRACLWVSPRPRHWALCCLILYDFPNASIIQSVCHRCELFESGSINMVEPSCVLFVSSVINCVHCITGLWKIRRACCLFPGPSLSAHIITTVSCCKVSCIIPSNLQALWQSYEFLSTQQVMQTQNPVLKELSVWWDWRIYLNLQHLLNIWIDCWTQYWSCQNFWVSEYKMYIYLIYPLTVFNIIICESC